VVDGVATVWFVTGFVVIGGLMICPELACELELSELKPDLFGFGSPTCVGFCSGGVFSPGKACALAPTEKENKSSIKTATTSKILFTLLKI